jgi:NADPH:quinone reductase
MKCIRVREFGGPEALKLEDADVPQPGRGEVLIRVKAIGVNPADTYMRSGAYGARNPALPYTPGSDAAGTVEAVGADVSDLKPGERVYTLRTLTGAYAELTLCKRAQVLTLPEKTSFAQGAALFVPYSTAYRGLFQMARAAPGEAVLVHGASGGVGIAAVQLARAAGFTVIGTAGTAEGLTLVAREGAHYTIDHHAQNFADEVLHLTEGRGVDVVLEMLANVNLGKDLKLLARRGRVVVIGSRGNVEITPRDLMQREASIHGVMLWNASETELIAINRTIYAGLENGSLRPVIGLELPLAQAAEAHRKVMEPGARGKIVLVP